MISEALLQLLIEREESDCLFQPFWTTLDLLGPQPADATNPKPKKQRNKTEPFLNLNKVASKKG